MGNQKVACCPLCHKQPTSKHTEMEIFSHFCLEVGKDWYWTADGKSWNPYLNFDNYKE